MCDARATFDFHIIHDLGYHSVPMEPTSFNNLTIETSINGHALESRNDENNNESAESRSGISSGFTETDDAEKGGKRNPSSTWVTWDGPHDPENPRNWAPFRGKVGGGILSDLWSSEERGRAIGIYTLMPLLGPAIGPITAGFIVRYSHWRWCFYSVSIADSLVQLSGFILLRETYPRVILSKKAKTLRAQAKNNNLRTEWENRDQSAGTTLRTAFKRPVKLITTQPIVQFIAIYMAFLYGLIYLLLSTFPRLWAGKYHETVDIAGLNYVSAGLGFFTGAHFGTRLQDQIYMALKGRNNGVGQPEFRVPLMLPSSTLVPAGYANVRKARVWMG
ncbi:MAG: hypothetical protein Q9160_007583 [Pyrenula sp. 1 TL-2023]